MNNFIFHSSLYNSIPVFGRSHSADLFKHPGKVVRIPVADPIANILDVVGVNGQKILGLLYTEFREIIDKGISGFFSKKLAQVKRADSDQFSGRLQRKLLIEILLNVFHDKG